MMRAVPAIALHDYDIDRFSRTPCVLRKLLVHFSLGEIEREGIGLSLLPELPELSPEARLGSM